MKNELYSVYDVESKSTNDEESNEESEEEEETIYEETRATYLAVPPLPGRKGDIGCPSKM